MFCFSLSSSPLCHLTGGEGSGQPSFFFAFLSSFFSPFPGNTSPTLFSNSPPRSTPAPFRRPSPSSPIKVGESVRFVVPRGDCVYPQVHSRECARPLVFACERARVQTHTRVHMLQLALAAAPKSQVLLKNIHPHSCAHADTHWHAHTHTPQPALKACKRDYPSLWKCYTEANSPRQPWHIAACWFWKWSPPPSSPPAPPPLPWLRPYLCFLKPIRASSVKKVKKKKIKQCAY